MVSSAQERKLKDSILKTHLSEKEDIFPSPTIVQNFAEKKKEKFCAQLMKTKMDANQKPNVWWEQPTTTVIGAHLTQYAKNNAQKDSYSANTKPSIPRDARSSQAAFTKERIITIYTALDIAHQSALEEKHLYLLDMMLTVVNFHLFAKYQPKKHKNSFVKI